MIFLQLFLATTRNVSFMLCGLAVANQQWWYGFLCWILAIGADYGLDELKKYIREAEGRD